VIAKGFVEIASSGDEKTMNESDERGRAIEIAQRVGEACRAMLKRIQCPKNHGSDVRPSRQRTR
jgi:hypothetical protein